jgi:hypothetical protein
MIDGEAATRHRHGQELGAEGAEDLHGARIGRLLDGDEVARIEQGARDEVEALLRPVHDEDVLRPRLEAEAE